MAAMSFLELDLDLRLSLPVCSEVESVFLARLDRFAGKDSPELAVDLALCGCSLRTGDESLRVGLDQIGSIESDGSGRSSGNGLAVTGTNKLRSVTEGNGSTAALLDRSICPAPAGKIFKSPINNGSAIVLDNQIIVDSFILIRGKDNNS
jgi:hypothetical protein